MMTIEKMMTPRLMAAASFVKCGSIVCDVGTDHAYIPIWLVLSGICPKAIAMDVRKGPLSRAKENIEKFGCKAQITTRLSDGLLALSPGEADTVVIAGMGGILINRILKDGEAHWDTVKHFILQPMTAIEETRKFLSENHFLIQDECLAKEDDKIYHILSVVRGEMPITREIDYHIGKRLIEKKDPLLPLYLDGKLYELDKAIASMEHGKGEQILKKREKFLLLYREMKKIREVCAQW